MKLKKLGSPLRTKYVPHSNRPDFSADPGQSHIFNVQTAIQEKGEPGAKDIHIHSAIAEILHVGKTVREGIRSLLNRGGTSFRYVISADRYRVPARHLLRTEIHHIGQESKGRVDRENQFVLRLDFLQDIGLNCSAELRHDIRAKAAFCRTYVHCEKDRSGTGDR